METVISVENVSKQYRLGQVGTGSLGHDLNRWWHKITGKEDPYLKIGETNDRSTKGNSDYVWALRNINFEVQAGEVLGIIGKNGAGKSTLLKILSRTTTPTTGQIKMKGRVASLLEVGTGFHPDLSGRENIYLNGAVLGMRKQEIAAKFDEIVDFSGVGRYIDTPVKRYSSGMYVRLAFAVAAHLEPEILIVDEVLAVGDAEFQKKCLGKMKEVSDKDGRTVLFVSHNLVSLRKICTKGILLTNGVFKNIGLIDSVADEYELITGQAQTEYNKSEGIVRRISIKSLNSADGYFRYLGDFELKVIIELNSNLKKPVIGFVCQDLSGVSLIGINNRHYKNDDLPDLNPGKYEATIKIPQFALLPGTYFTNVYVGSGNVDLEAVEGKLLFSVLSEKINPGNIPLNYKLNKIYAEKADWTIEKKSFF